jgi:LysM repeat protein
MNRRFIRVVAGAVLISILAWRAASTSAQDYINLLNNPSFEDSYGPWEGYRELIVSAGWSPWWIEREGDEGYILRRPECKPTDHFIFANRSKSGQFAQQCFTFYGTHVLGVYQQAPVQSGQLLRFSIWVQVWSTSLKEATTSELPGNIRVSVGIDPTGGTDPLSPVIHWSNEIEAYDQWHFQFVEEVAQNSTVTVFTRSRAEFAVMHNDVYWDEAGLVDADQALSLKLTVIPTATPKPTPRPGADSILYAPPVTDTLRVIAARFGVDWARVARANRVPIDVLVRPKFPVVVPGGHPNGAIHRTTIAQPGETLYSVAARYQYRPVDLAVLNQRYGPGMAWTGETLILP